MATTFKRITLQDWRQFATVTVDFDDRVTILTGANGSGKTTLLNLLARHFGWSIGLISTPAITKKGAWRYYSGAGRAQFEREEKDTHTQIGQITYSDSHIATLRVPPQVSENFHVKITDMQSVDGIYITSHRPVYTYQRVDEIPTRVNATTELFEQYLQTLRQHYSPGARINNSPSFRLKRSLISLATFGYGNRFVEPDETAQRTFESFQDVLRTVLPPDLKFKGIRITLPDVILHCETGDFSLDAASGGIAALIDLAWQVHIKSLATDQFVVVIDEPENHLHPRLQRTVLPGFASAFKKAQFIIATHNPFIVTSMRDASVVVLDFIDKRVHSKDISAIDRAASANKILMNVLGVPFPMPLWVEDEVDRVVESLSNVEINANTLSDTKDRLTKLGLGGMFPEVVSRLIEKPKAEH